MTDTLDPHDGGTTAPVTPPAASNTAQQVSTEPEVQFSEDGNQVTRGDVKYIRYEAVQQERQKRQELERTLSQLEPVLPEFQEFLENKRSGRVTATTRATQGAPADEYSQDELIAVAQLNRYYSEDGQSLDLDRARQALDLMGKIGERRARQIVEPVARTTIADRAAKNRQEKLSQQYVDGEPIAAPEFIQRAFDALPAELAADPGVADLVAVIAAGLQTLDGRAKGRTARREPNFTEGAPGRVDGSTPRGLSAFGQRAAQARGYTPEQWAKLQEKPTPQARADRDGGFILETGLD